MSLHVRELRTATEFAAIRSDWNRLVHLEGTGVLAFDVSATFEWAEAIWQAFPERQPCCILIAEDAVGIRGLMPCTIGSAAIAGVKHRQLMPTTGVYDLRTGFLVGGDAEVLRTLIAYALKSLKGWDALHFRVTESSLSDRALQQTLNGMRLTAKEMLHWRTPYIDLPSDPVLVLDGLGQKLKSNLRRAERQLNKLGRLSMQICGDEAAVPAFLEVMALIESRSWKMGAGTAMVTSGVQTRLYAAVTPALARHGNFLGAALMLDHQPLAFIYGFSHGDVFVDEKESYDEAFKDYGPGNLLKTMFLAELVRRGIKVFDYGGIEDSHKSRWTEASYSRRTYLITRGTLRGQLLKLSLAARRQLKSWTHRSS